jgi:hypothetical protein
MNFQCVHSWVTITTTVENSDPGVVAHDSNPTSLEAETKDPKFEASPGYTASWTQPKIKIKQKG